MARPRRALTKGRVALVVLALVAVVAAVPPLRRVAADMASKVILFVASPIAPDIDDFDELPKASTVVAADGAPLAKLDGGQSRQPLDLEALPSHVHRAVLAAEDASFYRHSGSDPLAIVRAAFSNVRGNDTQGASTITQQLAKLNYTDAERSGRRKLKEVLYAAKLEDRYSKDELLERYLNQVYFGAGAYGLTAASANFFAITPDRLTPAQAAVLAAKIHAPETLDPRRDPEAARAQRDRVLRNMREEGWLSRSQLDQALAEPMVVAPPPPAASNVLKAPHFVEYVKREARGIDGLGGTPDARSRQLFSGGYTVETTLDPRAFDAARAAVADHLGRQGDPTTAVVSVQPGDGAIRALFGGLDETLVFDVASQGRRQPGSSIKPYVYLAALGAGIDPRSELESGSPQELECEGKPFRVENFEGESPGGPRTIDDALTHSINVVFAQLVARMGPDDVARIAERAGVRSDDLKNPGCAAMALGGMVHGVTPIEQAAAYAAFAARGVYAEPYAIDRIRDRRGEVVYERAPQTGQRLNATETGVLTAALENVVRSGTGQAADIGRPMAGKTGTSENFGNAWFVGYVPQLATAVWVGYPDSNNHAMTNVHGTSVAGSTFPARVFHDYMQAALEGVPVVDLFRATVDELDLPPPPTTAPPETSTTLPTATTTPDPSPVPPTLPPQTVPPSTSPTTTTTTSPAP